MKKIARSASIVRTMRSCPNACQRRGNQAAIVIRTGMTLLEVLLSAVILAGALAALSQLATNGINASLRTELETMAAVKCQAKLDEILALPGANPFGVEMLCPDSNDWTWLAEVQPGPTDRLSVLSVTVSRIEGSRKDVRFQLTRLVSVDQLQSFDKFDLVSER